MAHNERRVVLSLSVFCFLFSSPIKDYTEFLVLQRRITQTRKTFDRALQALPLTQVQSVVPCSIFDANR